MHNCIHFVYTDFFSNKIVCRLATGYTLETPKLVDPGINFEQSSLKNMWTYLKFEKNMESAKIMIKTYRLN